MFSKIASSENDKPSILRYADLSFSRAYLQRWLAERVVPAQLLITRGDDVCREFVSSPLIPVRSEAAQP